MLLKGGKLVSAEFIEKKDIRIKGSKIKEIGKNLTPQPEEEVYDIRGKIVFPGIIDSHTHFKLHSRGTITVDDFYWGGRAAAIGGVTTHMDYADMVNGSLMEGLERRLEEIEDAVIDYHLHLVVNNEFEPKRDNEQFFKLRKSGISSLKVFTTYKGMYMLDYDKWVPLFKAAREAGLLVTVHAEKDEIIQENIKKYQREGKLGVEYHPDIRPGIAEAEAIKEVCEFARNTNSLLYIVHLSSKEGYREVEKARKRGLKVFVETTPHYLLLTRKLLKGPDGMLNLMTPPLREIDDNVVLWEGVKDGVIDVIATDHCAFNVEQKKEGSNSLDILPGIPGVETLLPLVYTFGVKAGRINLNRMVELLSTNPAKIFGLYPEKGSLKPGTDADLVVFDTEVELKLDNDNINTKAGYTPYQGIKLSGVPIITFLRGRVIAKDRKFIGEKGYGRFIEATS